MPLIHVTKILESIPGAKKDGAGYQLPEELDANAFIQLGPEAMQIPRIARVELTDDLVILVTHKGERFFFPPDRLVGLKLGAPTAKTARLSAGFSA
jgi:hypothetical protein